jgi:hypothetical protein
VSAVNIRMVLMSIRAANWMEAQKSGEAAVKDARMASIPIKSADWTEARA